MKNVLTATALLVGTMVSANVFAGQTSSYDVKVFNLDNEAVVKVMDNGQPVNNVPVTVKGATVSQQYTTSESGTVFVRNNSDAAQSLKISVQEPNGNEYTTERFVSSYQ
ncbi:hypothetical protein [Vibrio viridaestus]|uniref:Macroglobulin domain-containing protein n=1 Tax=Vibrio viridaestus TaxID=2487322 RepID=A0A3N9TMI4_9VIBR|nr:hypothetical protein [Vibrio viridaestus]RQW65063.1 hypothetical protein EES38_03245 [Vibrio viridaestus]